MTMRCFSFDNVPSQGFLGDTLLSLLTYLSAGFDTCSLLQNANEHLQTHVQTILKVFCEAQDLDGFDGFDVLGSFCQDLADLPSALSFTLVNFPLLSLHGHDLHDCINAIHFISSAHVKNICLATVIDDDDDLVEQAEEYGSTEEHHGNRAGECAWHIARGLGPVFEPPSSILHNNVCKHISFLCKCFF